MNSKLQYYLKYLIVIFGITLFFVFLSKTNALSSDVIFPVRELGNCQSQKDCRVFCDKSENIDVCVSFAENHNLISKEEAKKAKAFINSGKKGPGGCDGKESCEKYCNDLNNMNECIDFAEKHDLMHENDLKEAKKVQTAIKNGVKLPGNCRNKKECDVYCENSDNMEECLNFAETAGFVEKKELEEARKFMPLMKKGETPGGCKTKRDCEKYCSLDENLEECISFAEKIGFMSKEEVEIARKTGGKGPGGCKGKEECERFCENENNLEVCLSFAEEYRIISKEEAEIAKKTGGRGPGNCKGKEQCEKFCADPANEELCFNFAKEHGLIQKEDLEMMEEGINEIKELFEDAPEEVIKCLNSTLGPLNVQKMREGKIMPKRDTGEKIRKCFEETMKGEIMNENKRNLRDIKRNSKEENFNKREDIKRQIRGNTEDEIRRKMKEETRKNIMNMEMRKEMEERSKDDFFKNYELQNNENEDEENFEPEENIENFEDNNDTDIDEFNEENSDEENDEIPSISPTSTTPTSLNDFFMTLLGLLVGVI